MALQTLGKPQEGKCLIKLPPAKIGMSETDQGAAAYASLVTLLTHFLNSGHD